MRRQNRPGRRKRWTKHDFAFGSELGRGRFGIVFKAKEIETNRTFAIKVIEKQDIVKCKMENQMTREIRCHRQLSHPHILRFYDYFYDSKHIFLVLEYAKNGNLYDYNQKRKIPEQQLAVIIHQVAQAIHYCHTHDVTHRDIKPENVLLMENMSPKLADFGWCDHVPEENDEKLHFYCGTLDYISPEMLMNDGYDEGIDVWALGVMIYDLLVGKPPFEHEEGKETRRRIRNGEVSFFGTPISAQCRDLLRQVFITEPSERIGLDEFLAHPWFHQSDVAFR